MKKFLNDMLGMSYISRDHSSPQRQENIEKEVKRQMVLGRFRLA